MIRLIIVVVVIFFIWLLYILSLERKKKVVIAVIALILCGIAIWFESYDQTARDGVVALDSLEVCGVEGKHTYRSNFDVSICLENKDSEGTVKIVTMAVLAEQCSGANAECVLLKKAQRDFSLVLVPTERSVLTRNMDFKGVDPSLENVRWSATVLRVQATK